MLWFYHFFFASLERDLVDTYFHASCKNGQTDTNKVDLPFIGREKDLKGEWARFLCFLSFWDDFILFPVLHDHVERQSWSVCFNADGYAFLGMHSVLASAISSDFASNACFLCTETDYGCFH